MGVLRGHRPDGSGCRNDYVGQIENQRLLATRVIVDGIFVSRDRRISRHVLCLLTQTHYTYNGEKGRLTDAGIEEPHEKFDC